MSVAIITKATQFRSTSEESHCQLEDHWLVLRLVTDPWYMSKAINARSYLYEGVVTSLAGSKDYYN